MDFDFKISRLELQLSLDDALLQKLEEEFKTEATKLLRQWWWDATARIVQRSPERTRDHGPDAITSLKSRVSDLRDRAGEVVEEFLSDDRVWWHKKPREERDLSERYVCRSERIGPKQLDTGLRIAMGAIAPILLDFGYIEERRASQWLEWDETGDHHPPGARHCYPYALDWSTDLMQTARSYAERVQQSINRMNDIQVIQGRKAEREAESLWNKS